MSLVKDFLQKVIQTYSSGHAREHSYRPALKELFEKITQLRVINEPKRSEYGAPDFVFLKEKTVIAYAEHKDIDVSIEETEKGEQMSRYYGYSNIILTNGLEFRFYKNGKAYTNAIVIGKLHNGVIEIFEQSFQLLEDTINAFIKESKEPIKSGSVLAKVMAGKARRIRDNVKIFLSDENDMRNENLLSVYQVIKKLLLADLDYAKFADMYAQTIVYGLFVARYYDESPDNFSRQEARDLVPASNPFLRNFFDHIAGSSFDPRIEIIVNELCEEFNHADVQAIVHNYYKVSKDDSRDPIIHFYEDFLQEYDSAERKKMGVFYTPLPVVRFIVRSVDDILKKDFGLVNGLADDSKIEIIQDIQGKKKKIPVHKVQVLDPATGTGTFLNEAILHIKKSFVGQEGRWSSYVNENLLPRLHGFELMMASYTIAHLKLSSTIRETGAEIKNTRLGVYLTNSLEKGETVQQDLFYGLGLGKAITDESIQANRVKNELPIMVVIGNPPYSVSSQNKSEWIQDLIKEYKKDLNERKINLDDDYIKFIRFTEDLIEKNGEGIVGMITNNSFIDGITHRQMRKHLLETFDSIYIIDLHGNSKKKEVSPDGSKDENVFAIQQGVSIILGVKTGKKKKGLGNVYHTEFFGKQKVKFEAMDSATVENINWKKLDYQEPYYFFVPKDFSENKEYENGFKVSDLFKVYSAGIKTKVDNVAIDIDKGILSKRVQDIIQNKYSLEEMIEKFDLNPKTTWEYEKVLDIKEFDTENIVEYDYRPFDTRFTYYDKKFLSRSRSEVMDNFFKKQNVGLETSRNGDYIFISKNISDEHFISDNSFKFPLYIFSNQNEKIPNLEKEIVDKINEVVGATTPVDILDYIYAVLHSLNYREKYKEFLKIDFPRVPYPENAESFKKLATLGRELRELHLMESPKINEFVTTFSKPGNNTTAKRFPLFKQAHSLTGGPTEPGIYINETQYFGVKNITIEELQRAYNFYIGGYQPAQKWLKDRQGQVLSDEDFRHYQKMVVVLVETERIICQIDKI